MNELYYDTVHRIYYNGHKAVGYVDDNGICHCGRVSHINRLKVAHQGEVQMYMPTQIIQGSYLYQPFTDKISELLYTNR